MGWILVSVARNIGDKLLLTLSVLGKEFTNSESSYAMTILIIIHDVVLIFFWKMDQTQETFSAPNGAHISGIQC